MTPRAARLLTISAIAEHFGVTARTIRRWVRVGKLRGERTMGGHWRIRASEIKSDIRDKSDTRSA